MIDPEACSDVDQTFVSKQYSDCSDCDIESDVYSGLDYSAESETLQGSQCMEIHTSDSEVSGADPLISIGAPADVKDVTYNESFKFDGQIKYDNIAVAIATL